MPGKGRSRKRGKRKPLATPEPPQSPPPETPGATAAASPASRWEDSQSGAKSPQLEAQPGQPRAQPPELPESGAWPPGPRVQPPQLEAQPPQPGAWPGQPRAQPPQPGAWPGQPRAQPPQPGAWPGQPRAQPPQPGAWPGQPRAQPPQPGAWPGQPRAQPPQPGAWPGQPRAQPPQPGAWPGQPRAQPPQPGAWPGQPRAQPPQPGAWPGQPRAQPPQPGAWPGQPRAQPSQPGAWPGQPRAQPPQPGAWPGQPRAQPPQPGAWPGQPRAQPPQPEIQPPQPEIQPPQLGAQLRRPRDLPPGHRAQPPQLETQPPQLEAQPGQPGAPPAQEKGPAAASDESRRAEGRSLLPEGYLTAGARGRSENRGGIFQDLVVNIRKDLQHVKESKTGTEGNKIRLLTNHYEVKRGCEVAYKYNINYQPDVQDMNIRANLLLKHQSKLGKCRIFDGNSLLLPQRLRESDMELLSELEGGSKVKIRIQLSSELHSDHPDWIRYYNILFRRTLRLMDMGHFHRDESNFSELKSRLLAESMDIKRSYNTSILPYEDKLTLCADVAHRLFHRGTVYDIIVSTLEGNQDDRKKKKGKGEEKQESEMEERRQAVYDQLVGSIVLTTYRNKTYRVDDIDWEQSPQNTFKKFDGSMITFADYYREQYKIKDMIMNQPLLVSKGRWRKGQMSTPSETVYLVPQLCHLTGLASRVYKRHELMSMLTEETRMSPSCRRNALDNLMNGIQTNQNIQDEFLPWSVKFDVNCLTVNARVLGEVTLVQGNRRFTAKDPSFNWLNDSRRAPLLRPKPLRHWVVLYTKSCSMEANLLVNKLRTLTRLMRMEVANAAMYEVKDDSYTSYTQVLQSCTPKNTQMVVCVLPDNEKERYEGIKRFLCVEKPIPSQCVVASTLQSERTILSKITKIAQQMNCKMGGALWKVDTGMEKTMFFGIDCFHDIAKRQNSIAALVASTKEDLSSWYSQCLFQEPGEELVHDLHSCLQAALDSWVANEKQKPQAVVVYRDGVGDGQLQDLREEEVRQFLKFFCPSIKLTFIVVKKRIHTRFFVENTTEPFKNPSPGTVVDQVVTRKQWYDFYIVSQASNRGTVTPTHYNVIYDSKGLTPNQVQRLTYRLCYMYYNLPGVIRVPAPCHYAHKLAYFVGKSICQKPAPALSQYLYYL